MLAPGAMLFSDMFVSVVFLDLPFDPVWDGYDFELSVATVSVGSEHFDGRY
jgi:hypothetical protein